jgi:hypothetical protein
MATHEHLYSFDSRTTNPSRIIFRNRGEGCQCCEMLTKTLLSLNIYERISLSSYFLLHISIKTQLLRRRIVGWRKSPAKQQGLMEAFKGCGKGLGNCGNSVEWVRKKLANDKNYKKKFSLKNSLPYV